MQRQALLPACGQVNQALERPPHQLLASWLKIPAASLFADRIRPPASQTRMAAAEDSMIRWVLAWRIRYSSAWRRRSSR